jgi:hypothetical protein
MTHDESIFLTMSAFYRWPCGNVNGPEKRRSKTWGSRGSSAAKPSFQVFQEFFMGIRIQPKKSFPMPWGNGYFPATRGSGSRDIANKTGQR